MDWNEGYGLYGQSEPRLASLKSWEKASKDDPLFVLQVDWRAGVRLREAMGKSWGTLPSAQLTYNLLKTTCDELFRKCWEEVIGTLTEAETAKLESETLDFLSRIIKGGR